MWLKTLFDPHCLLCGLISNSRICTDCFRLLPIITTACHGCGLPTTQSVNYCGACLNENFSFDACVSLMTYQGMTQSLIAHFKQGGNIELGEALGLLLYRHLQEKINNGMSVDLIVPVPVYFKVQQQRGFNQAEVIAKILAKQWSIPIDITFCSQVNAVSPQKGLNLKQRKSNLINSFIINKDVSHIRHLILVDDIVTTGATVDYLSGLFKKGGVQKITVASLARTIRH